MKRSRPVYRGAVLPHALSLALLLPVALQAQGRIEGQVINATTRQPVPGQEVLLLVPRERMQQVAKVTADANGRFAFSRERIGSSDFYLLQTTFQRVHYPTPVQFDSTGQARINLTVYATTRSDHSLRIQSLRILVRAEGSRVRVEEGYLVQNSTQPPQAYADPEGTFHFQISEGASEPQVAVTSLMNMPLPQPAEPGKSSGEFFIRYPFKPGTTLVTVSYEAEYAAARFALADRVFYPIDHAEMYVFPLNLSVASPVFKRAGVDSANGVQTFEAENLPRGVALITHLTGAASPSAAPAQGQAEPQIRTVPNSMTRLGVPLLLCFLLVLLWALGVRIAKEWPHWQVRRGKGPAQKELESAVESLLNSLADLDELFAAGKIAEERYWEERLELKARVAALLRQGPPVLLASYATRQTPR